MRSKARFFFFLPGVGITMGKKGASILMLESTAAGVAGVIIKLEYGVNISFYSLRYQQKLLK